MHKGLARLTSSSCTLAWIAYDRADTQKQFYMQDNSNTITLSLVHVKSLCCALRVVDCFTRCLGLWSHRVYECMSVAIDHCTAVNYAC
jgi:hypothetical protein